jgi:hypothetical protein
MPTSWTGLRSTFSSLSTYQVFLLLNAYFMDWPKEYLLFTVNQPGIDGLKNVFHCGGSIWPFRMILRPSPKIIDKDKKYLQDYRKEA